MKNLGLTRLPLACGDKKGGSENPPFTSIDCRKSHALARPSSTASRMNFGKAKEAAWTSGV